jgi:RNA polymerase sigma-70 factor (ECF subfamily)
LEEVFRQEYVRLVRALSVASGSVDAATDAVQESFLAAARHWRRISGYDDPAAWLRHVALHRLADQRRASSRRQRALPRLAAGTTTADREPDVDLANAVAALPQQQRVAVCLHYLADLSVADVAEAMGVTEGTVKSHLHDGRVALRRVLGVPSDD